MLTARCANRWLVVCGLAVAACGGKPTDPTQTATPTPVPVVTCSANQPLRSFTAEPAIITEGDPFTLRWEGPCGWVTLTRKTAAPFAMSQPSSGSYQVKAGANGYPTGTGVTVYEAANGDLSPRLQATVTVNARPATPTPTPEPTAAPTVAPNRAPTVTVSAAAATCHPHPSVPCSVTCTATASDLDGDALIYAWAGCASGTGPTATCTVSDLKAHTCDASVSDGRGGAALASASVTGVNDWPHVYFEYRDPSNEPMPANVSVRVEWTVDDDQQLASLPVANRGLWMAPTVSGRCTYESHASTGTVRVYVIYVRTMTGGGDCTISAAFKDPWNVDGRKEYSFPVSP